MIRLALMHLLASGVAAASVIVAAPALADPARMSRDVGAIPASAIPAGPLAVRVPPDGEALASDAPRLPAPGRAEYLVVPHPGESVAGILRRWAGADHGDDARRLRGEALRAGVLSLTPVQARRLGSRPGVAVVEPNSTFTAQRLPLSWGLDRSDDRQGLDDDYSPATNGAGVRVYVLDGNVVTTHPEFAGRIGTGVSFVADGTGTVGCDAHGTHVAGIIGSNLLGMATEAILHPVRVLDCTNSGTAAAVIEGVNWVLADWRSRGSPPAVVNMSIGGPASAAVATAVSGLAAAGMVVVAAAGNAEGGAPPVDACTGTPANVGAILTVGAVDITDTESAFSNWGPCLDLYAPGEDILSTDWAATPNTALQASGTSQAAPHVAGAVAVYWSQFPQARGPQVQQAILAQASSGLLRFLRPGVGSPNLLLNAEGTAPPPAPPATPAPVAPPALQQTPVELPAPRIDPVPGTTVRLRPPGRVTQLRVSRATRTSVSVRFRKAPSAEQYTVRVRRIEPRRGRAARWLTAGTTVGTRFTVRGLRPATKYRISVAGKNPAGTSRRTVVRATTRGGR